MKEEEAATQSKEFPIFVFGSNLKGVHGRGAALFAFQKRGAVYGIGMGRQGMSWAIPTKYDPYHSLPLSKIRAYVHIFLLYADTHPDLTFEVTRIGCGLAGYTDADISPLFKGAPSNCLLPAGWHA